ncbi:ribosomal protein s17 [Zalerion maritima]|uniref:Ribosomal protein s17 n=1 Tax=Zalerion maritima TaxID=339359 RepID=A0AAD5RW83_9PEZI|nr:ribosomal protein s17 [Zalerion maritima]
MKVSGQVTPRTIDDVDATTLLPSAIQIGSFFDGTDALGASDEQSPAQTSQNNFINFCAGKTLTDGLQILEGSCSGIHEIESGLDLRIEIQVTGLVAGAFTNAVATCCTSPQVLENGKATLSFAFFKGINDAGNGNGQLFADVEGGLPPGNYRRGSQDDCTKFTVVGDDFDTKNCTNDEQNSIHAAADVAAAVDLGPGAIEDEDVDAEDADANAEGNAEADVNDNVDANTNANQDQNQANDFQTITTTSSDVESTHLRPAIYCLRI